MTAPETESATPPIALHLLGGFSLEVRGRPASTLSRAARSLLALLAIRSPQPVDRETLALTLWPDSDDEAARYNLRRTTTELRNVLGSEAGRLVSHTRSVLALDLSEGAYCDVLAFDRAIAAKTDENLEFALDLYETRGGTLLEGERGEWVLVEREERAMAYLAARERLATRFAERGQWQDALRHLRAILVLDPTRETAVRNLMRALSASGQSAAALAAYHSLRTRLRIDAGAAPDAETTAFYRNLQAESQRRTGVAKSAPSLSAEEPVERQRRINVADNEIDDEAEVFSSPAIVFPTGAVTFLFTDIEGSTRSWQANPEEMRLALLRHDRLVQDAIAAANGVVFKSVGDGFYAAFATPTDAVVAAVEAQRSLRSELWPETTPIRVRMAIHTGAAELRDGDYFGNTLNRTARLLSAGHGGQILVSLTSHELLRDFLPPGIALRSLGKQWLRDIDRPEDIFAVAHPDLQEPDSFPPLRTLESPSLPNNLPRSTTSFVGRERQMADVTGLLAKASLLTLVGTGGTGKTRLSLQVATEALENYPDGAWLVELASISDAGLVPQTVAHALGLNEHTGQTVVQTLTNQLQSKRILIVLDNCEHIIAACARIADELIRTCPQLTILATSREALGVTGEQLYRVPALSIPDLHAAQPRNVQELCDFEAAHLFLERVSLIRPEYALRESDVLAVAQLCCRLDGIPLALELAAARVRSLTISEINERLGRQFRLLANTARSVHPRQQTLSALIDWSYDLLGDAEKTVLRRLSVFSGSWSVAAAESVCGFDPIEDWEVLDILTSLVDKSLVLADDDPNGTRFHMLETIRQYSQDKILEAEELATTRSRHQAFFLELAETAEPELTGPDQTAWMTRVAAEHDNLRAALAGCGDSDEQNEIRLRIASALWHFWNLRGYYIEGRLNLTIALERAPAPTALRAKSLVSAGILAQNQGDIEAARSLKEAGLAIQRTLGDNFGIATALNAVAAVATDQGDYAKARILLEESVEISRTLEGKRGTLLQALNSLGVIAYNEGDYPRARLLYEETLSHLRALGNTQGVAILLNNLAVLTWDMRDLAAAQALHEESLSLRRQLGDKPGIATSLLNLGLLATSQREFEVARSMYEEGLAVCREVADGPLLANVLNNLGVLLMEMENYPAAQPMLEESLVLYKALGAKRGGAFALEALASLAIGRSEVERSVVLRGAADALREHLGAPLSANDLEARADQLKQARSLISEADLAAALERGRSMAWEQAIDFALSRTEGRAPSP